MLPTAREIDELEDRISELEHDLEVTSQQRDDYYGYLADLDEENERFKKKIRDLEGEIDGLGKDVRDWEEIAKSARERAEVAEAEARVWADFARDDVEDFYSLASEVERVQERATGWLEVAKDLLRSRNQWMLIADSHLRDARETEGELFELRAALRILGGKGK